MTVGIYSIYFETLDKVYIGQSQQVEQRISCHKSLFKKEHPNYKLASAYTKDQNPSYWLLEECLISELDSLEVYYIKEFDAVTSGLNISTGGTAGNRGTNSGKSLYTKEQLITAFDMLSNEIYTLAEISEVTTVSKPVLSHLCSKSRHLWLHEEYPNKSETVIRNKSNRFSNAQVDRYKTNAIVVSPSGVEHTISNRNKFAKEHGLNSGHLGSLIRDQITQHKGWTLKKGGSVG